MRGRCPSPRRSAVAVAITSLTCAAVLVAPPPAVAVEDGCRTYRNDLDLNGDNFDDAVVGDPYATVDGKLEAGAVVVLFGDADGRIGQGARKVITQASVPGSRVEAGDHFGWAVTIDDASMDGCGDLLVGSPGEDWNGQADAGIAHLITLADAATVAKPRLLGLLSQHLDSDEVEAGDEFGSSVAIADAGGADSAQLLVGSPGEDVGTARDAGAVVYFDGQFGQFGGGGLLTQGAPALGRLGTPQAGDRFGAAVLIAQLHPVAPGEDYRGTDWVYVASAPGDTVTRAGGTAVDGAGSVTVWEDVVGYHEVVTQETVGVPGVAEAGDAFGTSLAVGLSRGQGTDARRIDLAVGSPGEDIGTVRDAGAVTLLEDEQTGFRGRLAFDQGTPGFAGSVEAGDHFGRSVALLPASAGSDVVLSIGVPDEDLGSTSDAGLVQTVLLADSDAQVAALTSYTENSAGTPAAVGPGHHFGRSVGAIEGLRESILTMSSPYAGAGSVFVASTDGTSRGWVPGQGGIPGLGNGRFGWSVSGLEVG